MVFFEGTRNTYLVVAVANIIAFLSGTALAWSSPVLAILQGNDIDKIPIGRKITDDEESWIGSLASMGGIFGPFIIGYLMQRFGRKTAITLIAFSFLSGYLIAAFAELLALFYVARILMGMGIGAVFCAVPVYVAETAENVNRGLLQASSTSFIMLGILFSNAVGSYVSIMVFNLILSAICVIFIPAFWFLAPETVYYLISNGNEQQALKSLNYLRRRSDDKITQELNAIKSHFKDFKPGSFLDIFKTKVTLKGFGYAVALTTFQQFSGVLVITYFTQNIFDATGSDLPPKICAIIVGSVQVVVSLISPPFLDKVGRKILLIVAVCGALIAEVLLGVYFYLQKNGNDVSNMGWLPVLSLGIFITFYNFGMGSIPWAVMGEILPLNVKTKAAVLTTSFYWVTGFFLTKYFGALSDAIGMAGSFWLFAGFCVLFELFNIFFMFETKGKSFSDIQAILNR